MIAICELYTVMGSVSEERCKQCSAGKVTAGSPYAVVLPAQLPGLLFWKQRRDFPLVPVGQVGFLQLQEPRDPGWGIHSCHPRPISVIGQGWANENYPGALTEP